MSSPRGGRLGRRLSRILLMLPYAINHPGVTVDELSRKFGVRQTELIEDLNLLFLCGLPGYGPGDLIEIELDEDHVHVRMADYFASPLRLTAAEGLSLLAGGEAIAALPELAEADALRRALSKLRRALGTTEDAQLRVAFESGAEQHLSVLQAALDASRTVQIEYLAASSEELTTREVDPWGLIAAQGRWYLVALDHRSGEERMFRVDRMKSARPTGTAFTPPDDFDPVRYKGAFVPRGNEPTMSMEISPRAARWFEDYYPVISAEALADGWRSVELTMSSEIWGATLLLRLGEDVRHVEPASVVERCRSAATAIAARHAG